MKPIVLLSFMVTILCASCQRETFSEASEYAHSAGTMRPFFKPWKSGDYTDLKGTYVPPSYKMVIHTEFQPARVYEYNKLYYCEFFVPCKEAGGTLQWRYLIEVPAKATSKIIEGPHWFHVAEEDAQQLTYVIVPIKKEVPLSEIWGVMEFDMKWADHPIKLKPWVVPWYYPKDN